MKHQPVSQPASNPYYFKNSKKRNNYWSSRVYIIFFLLLISVPCRKIFTILMNYFTSSMPFVWISIRCSVKLILWVNKSIGKTSFLLFFYIYIFQYYYADYYKLIIMLDIVKSAVLHEKEKKWKQKKSLSILLSHVIPIKHEFIADIENFFLFFIFLSFFYEISTRKINKSKSNLPLHEHYVQLGYFLAKNII